MTDSVIDEGCWAGTEEYASHWMIAWSSARHPRRHPAGEILVGPWPDKTGWSKGYSAVGWCNACFHGLSKVEQSQRLANLFVMLVLQDGLDPVKVHQAFWKIQAWRDLEAELPSQEAGYRFFLKDGTCSPHNP